MTYIFMDAESTGFPSNSKAPRHEGQARICQYGVIVTDEYGKVMSEVACLVEPDGWSISEGAQEQHGYSDEDCQSFGWESRIALDYFLETTDEASTLVCHNLKFDWRMLEIEVEAHNLSLPEFTHKFCTMKLAKPICGLRTKTNALKNPSLQEAHKILCGAEFEGGHNALVDARACMNIFFALQERKAIAA